MNEDLKNKELDIASPSFNNQNEIHQTNNNFTLFENVFQNEQMIENFLMTNLFTYFNI
jgi:hypothetical protein